MKESKPSETQKEIRPDVDVIDAWMHAFDLAKGIDQILHCAACSDDGFGPEGAKTLDRAAEQMVEYMNLA